MKINIFDNEDMLIEYLKYNKGAIQILDFSKSKKIKRALNNKIIFPYNFSLEEKHNLLEEYIETIFDLGKLNNYSLYWLCHPISEKNDLIPSNLFSQITDFLSFYRSYSALGGHELAVLINNRKLSENIYSFAKKNNISCEYFSLKSFNRSFLVECKLLLTKFKNYILFINKLIKSEIDIFVKQLDYTRKSKILFDKIDKNLPYTILQTLCDYRSKALMDQDRDIYFGNLPGFIKSKGENILFYSDVIDSNKNFDSIIKTFEENQKNPILFFYALLNFLDYIKARIFRIISSYKIITPDVIMIQGVDLGYIFNNYIDEQLKNTSFTYNYLSYTAMKNLFQEFNIVKYYYPFENYAYEKVIMLAIREISEKTEIIGFQHAQVALSSTKFFLGKEEANFIPLPDKIITVGKFTRDFLDNEKNYPADITVVGCALRDDHSKLKFNLTRKNGNRILVFGWTFERSIDILNFLNESKLPLDKYTVKVSPHPNHPFEKLQPNLTFSLENSFVISTDSLINNLKDADVVLYSGSTTCIDSLAFGLPVVNMEFDDFISPDPLFNFNDFKWTVTSPENVVDVICSINSLTDEEYYSRQERGLDFVRKYYYPVNEENLKYF